MAQQRRRTTRGIARRDFLKATVAGAAGVAAGLGPAIPARAKNASGASSSSSAIGKAVGGGLVVAGPELALPPGFTYKTFGAFGSPMQDGFTTPPIPDGMGVFSDGAGMRIVRNHELGDGNDIVRPSVVGIPTNAYDRKAPGCTTTLHPGQQRRPGRELRERQRHGHELRRRSDAMGHVPLVRGNHDRHIVEPEQGPRLCLRDRPDERWLRPGQAVASPRSVRP